MTTKPVFIKDAVFLSYTSLNDFAKCPHAYYLKNVYRDPRHGYKLQLASPYLTLGATVHDTIKWYLESFERPTKEQTIKQFRNLWQKYRGKRGGFVSLEDEANFGRRGLSMLDNFLQNVGSLGKSAPPVSFPKHIVVDNIVLTGNMDYVEELPDGTLHIIDFKTGSKDEDDPQQLYLYAILAEDYYDKKVSKISFWYLDRDDKPKVATLDPLEKTLSWLVNKGLEIKQALTVNDWQCSHPTSPCRDCVDYQAIIAGKGEFLFTDYTYKKEVYFLEH